MDAVPAFPTAAILALVATQFAGGTVPQLPAAAPIECEITDATLTWGFKESFRAYVDGDIANGEWTTADGASYETPEFTWSGGTGTYTPIYDDVTITFAGSVHFTGHDGLLDTTIADPTVELHGGTGTLTLDVAGPTMDGTPVDVQDVSFVTLDAGAVSGDDAERTVEAETALTSDGSEAFPNYAAGEAFDPVSITMTVGKECPLTPPDDVSDDGNPALMGPLAGGIALVIVAGAGVFFATRRRRA